MRISDWSSDVCSSDLPLALPAFGKNARGVPIPVEPALYEIERHRVGPRIGEQIGHLRPPAMIRNALALHDRRLHLDVERQAGRETEFAAHRGVDRKRVG